MRKLLFVALAALMLLPSCTQKPKYRILSCGVRHESNTFSTIRTEMENFTVMRGEELFESNQPWVEYLRTQKDVEFIPTTHAYSWPGGQVTLEAYEQFKGEILEAIRNAGQLDGIYMDMHGALHVEGMDDAQADLVKEIRAIVGDSLPISASFDLHGNVSDEFLSGLNYMTGFRTAPHRDGAETKLRAVKALMRMVREGIRPCIAHAELPMLIPGEKSITEVEPMHSIYARIDSIEALDGIMDATILVGYAWADLPRSAMRVFVVAEDSAHFEEAGDICLSVAQQLWNKRFEMEMDVPSGNIKDMIRRAYEIPDTTVFISDSGDNTTAGAPGDNPQVIKALLEEHAENALFAGLVDKAAFDQCREAGIGAELKLTLGGVKDYVFGSPLTIDAKVIDMSSEETMAEDNGIVLIESDGLKIALLSRRTSFTTVKQFEDIHLNPLDFKVVVVKLGYLYPELRDIAPVHLIALTSGFCNLDMRTLPFKNVQRPAYPLDLDMTWEAHLQ